MFTIIGADGKEYGPVPAHRVQEWITGGRANLQTKARRAGDADWRTLADFPEFGAPPPMAEPPAGLATPADIPAPAAAPATPAAPADAAALIAGAGEIDIGGCLSRSIALWSSNFLSLVGVTLLVVVVQVALGFIPILGLFAGLLNGVFYGGLYYFYLGKIRGEPRELGDAFSGFSQAFGSLVVAALVIGFSTAVIALTFAAPVLFTLVKSGLFNGHSNTLPDFGAVSLVLLGIGLIIAIYLSIAWAFTFALIMDKRLGPWEALDVSRRVVSRQWFRLFAVMFVGSLLSMLGVIGLFIGVIFTLPLSFGALMYAYEDAVGRPRRGPPA